MPPAASATAVLPIPACPTRCTARHEPRSTTTITAEISASSAVRPTRPVSSSPEDTPPPYERLDCTTHPGQRCDTEAVTDEQSQAQHPGKAGLSFGLSCPRSHICRAPVRHAEPPSARLITQRSRTRILSALPMQQFG